MCVFAAVLTAGSISAAHTSKSDSLPCSVTFERLAGGARLGLSVTCTAENVVVVRVVFPHTATLLSQRPFASASCQDPTPTSWDCLFNALIPANTTLIGSVKFKKAIPRATQQARVFLYETQDAPANVLLPHAVNIDPSPFVGTFGY